jgi:hypothetical protein
VHYFRDADTTGGRGISKVFSGMQRSTSAWRRDCFMRDVQDWNLRITFLFLENTEISDTI